MLAQEIDELKKKKVKLISIARESPRKLKELYDSLENPIQLIADEGGKIAKQYDILLSTKDPVVEKIGMRHALPSKFLINREGIIVWKELSPFQSRPSLSTIINAIESYISDNPR